LRAHLQCQTEPTPFRGVFGATGLSGSQETDLMKYHSRALAGTALGLFMAASTAGAAKLHPVADNIGDPAVGAPLVLAQADNETPAEKKARKAEKRARQE